MPEFFTTAEGGETAATPEQEIIDTTARHLRRMRYFRRQYDQRRAHFYRMYLGQKDQKHYPDNITPRSNTFIPYPLSNVETIVSRVMDAFFSFTPWFEARGRGVADEPKAEKMQMVLDYLLRKSNFQNAFEALVRNLAIYGHSGFKVDWDWGTDRVNYEEPILVTDPNTGEPVIDPQTGMPAIQGVKPAVKDIPRARPRFTAIDIYDLMVDPDGGLTAHIVEKTFGELKREAAGNPKLYKQEGIELLATKLQDDKDPDAVVLRIAELWNEFTNTVTIMTFGEDSEAVSWKDLRASFRAAHYTAWKRKVYAGQPILLQHGDNPFLHRNSAVLHTSFIKLPNEVYGLGAVEIIADLTNALNNFVNMITDNWNLGINRRYAYDINADIDHESLNSFNVPGGKVGVSGDPNNVLKELPFFTPHAQDYQVITLYKGMVEMAAGISDFYGKGVGSPTGNRTATGINQVISESNHRFRLFIRNLEVDILQPVLEMCASMVMQFVTDDIEVQITDAPPGFPKYPLVPVEELIGTFNFELVAANYVENKVIRQRNLLAWANWASQSPYWNWHGGLEEMGKAFELRNLHKMLKSEEQVAQEQQAQQQQQIQMMILESMLGTESKARIAQAKPTTSKDKQGRPRTVQFEGKIPGAGLSSEIRELAQSMGANALGLGGNTEGGK